MKLHKSVGALMVMLGVGCLAFIVSTDTFTWIKAQPSDYFLSSTVIALGFYILKLVNQQSTV